MAFHTVTFDGDCLIHVNPFSLSPAQSIRVCFAGSLLLPCPHCRLRLAVRSWSSP